MTLAALFITKWMPWGKLSVLEDKMCNVSFEDKSSKLPLVLRGDPLALLTVSKGIARAEDLGNSKRRSTLIAISLLPLHRAQW